MERVLLDLVEISNEKAKDENLNVRKRSEQGATASRSGSIRFFWLWLVSRSQACMTFHNHLQGSKTEFAQRCRPQLLGPAKPSPAAAGDSVNCRSSEVSLSPKTL